MSGAGPRGTAAPSASFIGACEAAGVAPEHHLALWGVHAGRPEARRRDPEALRDLLADYRHWTLFEASRAGDARAARRFERYWTRQLAKALGRRFRSDQVEEVTALFFERVFRLAGDRFRWQAPFGAYLRAILANLVRDHVRRLATHREREVSLEEDEDLPLRQLTSDAPSAEEELLAGERAAALRRALWKLRPIDRRLVLGSLVDGLSGEELADRMGIKRQAAYMRLHRAKKQLARLLEEEGIGRSDGMRRAPPSGAVAEEN